MAAQPHSGEKVLQIYTWHDFFDSTVLAKFQEQYQCRVELSFFQSNEEMYMTLQTGYDGYDLITPSSYMAARMWRENMLQEFDKEKIPNLANLCTDTLAKTEDPSMQYSIPYMQSISGVAYVENSVRPEDLGSWNIFGNSQYKNRLTLLTDMRETIGAALKYLGYSLNTVDDDELQQARMIIETWKSNGIEFRSDMSYLELNSADKIIGHTYNNESIIAMEDNPHIRFYIPREGASLVGDDFVLPKNSVNAELAHAFVNHILDLEMAKLTMEGLYYMIPLKNALDLVDPELAANPAFSISSEALAASEVIRDLGPDNYKYEAVWDAVAVNN